VLFLRRRPTEICRWVSAFFPAEKAGKAVIPFHPTGVHTVAAIVAHDERVDCMSLGKHGLINRFLRGVRMLNPLRLVLLALHLSPWSQLSYLKMPVLTALTSIKRAGDLQALSVTDMCLVGDLP